MATTQQYALRWNNFVSTLSTGFSDLLENAEMVDVTIAVDGRILRAHKIVLSICSPYFKQMFKESPCKHPIVILKDVCYEYMKDILEFMYKGEVSVLQENLSSFLRTAELLQVKGLSHDDSTESSSSRKEDKADCDESENDMYNQMIETTSDVELPSYRPPSPEVTPTQLTKRPIKTGHSNGSAKRPKHEPHNSTPRTPKPEAEAPTPKSECNSCDYPEMPKDYSDKCASTEDEAKYVNKIMWESHLSNVASPMDSANIDQDGSLFNAEKGHVFCPYCCRKFVNRYNLKVHIRDKHEASSTLQDCEICGKTMRNQSCLRVHMYHHRKQQTEAGNARGIEAGPSEAPRPACQ